VGAWHGDRVVLRDAAASRTLAGGTVLDVLAPVRYRRTPARLAELAAQSAPDAPARLAALLAASAQGVALGRWRAAQGLAAEAADPTDPSSPRTALPLPGGSLHRPDASGGWVLGAAQAQQAAALVQARLVAFHAAHPEELGPDAARLRRLAQPRLPDPLWQALLAGLQTGGVLLQRGAFVHLPEHGLRLSVVDERIAQKVAPRLAQAGFEGAWARDLARDCAEGEALMRTTLARLAQRGELHQVVKDLYYPIATIAALVALARGAATAGEVNAATFRDVTRLGRKRAIQILEYFDRIGVLRRVGDVHKLRSDTALFMGP
jgi:selenocysteine-specific elongation factor